MGDSPQDLQKLLRAGLPLAVLNAIDPTSTDLAPFRQSLFLFDANWALGNLDAALAHLDRLQQLQAEDARLADRFAIAYRHTRDERWLPVTLAPSPERTFSEPETNRIAELFLRLSDLAGCEQFLNNAARTGPLSPRLMLRLARIKYLQNDFEFSEQIATQLLATDAATAAERLLRTIAFRRGEFERVLEHGSSPLTDFDHLRYNALLAVGQIADAFAMMPFPGELNDLVAVFPGSGRRKLSTQGETAAILSESGPGDQLLDVVALRRIADTPRALVMTIDPRLHSLLSRSYPGVTFLPSPRLDRSALGHLAPGHDRHTGELVDLLTTEAYEIGRACDQVVLARSLKAALGSEVDPQNEPRLQPRDDLVSKTAQLGRGKVGLCWRSEMQNPSRDIHYFEASELDALFTGGHHFVCLQHDATNTERAQLHQMARGRIDFVEGIDLRNDFEQTAALMSNLRCVVGPGTTATVLAASVGTPTVVMHPTHFGTWLAQLPHDYWFASRKHLVATYPLQRQDLVAETNKFLRDQFPPADPNANVRWPRRTIHGR